MFKVLIKVIMIILAHVHLRTMEDLIKKGAIKPLPRTVFGINDVEKAFRHMGVGKHIGKVLIKIRDEEPEKVSMVQRKLFKAVPRWEISIHRTDEL